MTSFLNRLRSGPAHKLGGGPSVQIAIILFVAAALALCLFWPIRSEVTQYDEAGYATAAAGIAQNGLFSKFPCSDFRTYLYPAVLAFSAKFLGIPAELTPGHGTPRGGVFTLQLVIFFTAALCIARALYPIFGRTRTVVLLACLCLNPFTLIFLAYVLTEPFTLIFNIAFITAVAMSFHSRRSGQIKAFAIGGLAIGAALMTHPSNVYLVGLGGAAVLLHLIIGVRSGDVRHRILLSIVGMFCAAIICLPQWVNNYRHFGRIAPLIVHDAGGIQFELGRENMKYGTYVGHGSPPGLLYRNPFLSHIDPATSSAWHSLRGWFLSSAIKLFALIDQDYMRPYIFSLTPPDRWVGTILSTSIALLGLTGLLHQGRLAVAELRRSHFRTITGENAFALSCLIVVAGRFALYSQVEIEARFGLLLLAVLGLFVPTTLRLWHQLNRTARIVSAICFLLVISQGCILSHWIQMHSEPIARAWGT